jgi:hypothetical protein
MMEKFYYSVPSLYGFSHGLLALAVCLPASYFGWHYEAAIFAIAFYYGREAAQAEVVEKVIGFKALLPWKWSWDGQFDLYVPAAVALINAYIWSIL